MKNYALLIIILLSVNASFGQTASEGIKEVKTYDNALLIAPTFTFHIPGAETAHRFGPFSSFGMSIHYKFGKNWSIGGEGNFMFGSKVKEDGHIVNATVLPNLVISSEGTTEEVNLSGRGTMVRMMVHKTFPFKASQPNSGLQIGFGAGYLMHKILIDVNKDITPQLTGDYVKGYDRLTQGFVLTEYIGLMKLEKGKLVNLSFGMEFAQGITKNTRPYDFFQGRKLDKTRFEFMVGFKLTWIIPVFMGESSSSEYFYY